MVKERNNKKKKNKAGVLDIIKQQNISGNNRMFVTINQSFIFLDNTFKCIKKNICHLYLFDLGVILYVVNLTAKRFIKMQDVEFWETTDIGLI